MNSKPRPLVVVILAFAFGASALLAPAQPPGETVLITLRPEVTVDDDIVRVGQVAHLAGGTARSRAEIAELDLAEFQDRSSLLVSRDQVKFRLLVAGVAERSFRQGDLAKTLVRRAGGPRTTVRPGVGAGLPGAVTPVKNEEIEPPSPVLVKARERVRMVARIGPVSAIVAGEAQQDGRFGQVIRLRNVDSNKTVQGRVVGPGYVEVDY